jgi:hypothetical protein
MPKNWTMKLALATGTLFALAAAVLWIEGSSATHAGETPTPEATATLGTPEATDTVEATATVAETATTAPATSTPAPATSTPAGTVAATVTLPSTGVGTDGGSGSALWIALAAAVGALAIGSAGFALARRRA